MPVLRQLTGIAAMSVALNALLVLQGCDPRERPAEEARPTAGTPGRSNLILQPADADRLWVFPESGDSLGSGGEFHIYLDAETRPRARAAFAKFDLGPGGALPAHRHERTEEISYFVAGQGVVEVFEDGERQEVPVRAGHVWYVPPGAWHGLRNTGETPLELVFATVPNEEQGLLSFFRRIGVKPGQEPERLSPEDLARIAAEHDLILRRGTEQ